MSKIDFKKELKHLYRPSAKNEVAVDVPEMNFLMIDGLGEPGSESFGIAIEALYSVSYTLKFMIKKGDIAVDYGVLPLEGLWWADDMADFIADNKANWKWTLMIMQPSYITKALVGEAIEQVRTKKKLASVDKLRFEAFTEGSCAQTMHIGPFSEEGPTVERVHRFIESNGNQLAGKHHEIYLSDFRRTKPENLKTIIRQPYS
ncbi:GyrI-like domain-containing protein [Vibrio tapetis subsp. quintayensis]|uniref:GyrI-like domain-containing protein n=1 Tax=Vibrio tapetis TaxID=52443 RepID=UPI0025B5B89A|nr:GyrI-like domain-containing protein [Vibrio tapetis]MDN3681943.1 GyrI-like domain-containing protein [Vibrio tapetis subsp. quintayensis]